MEHRVISKYNNHRIKAGKSYVVKLMSTVDNSVIGFNNSDFLEFKIPNDGIGDVRVFYGDKEISLFTVINDDGNNSNIFSSYFLPDLNNQREIKLKSLIK